MKKCAVFNDISGFGKCSLMAALPVLAVMKCEAHPVLTSVLSMQTGFPDYSIKDMSDFIPSCIEDWKKSNAHFDAVLTGFISSDKQFKMIDDFMADFKTRGGNKPLLVVDPVMADDGARYDSFDDRRCDGIKHLALKADIITPNVSELAIIAGKPYSNQRDKIAEYANMILSQGVGIVVVTGVRDGGRMHTLVYDEKGEFDYSSHLFSGSFSGAGDLMSAVITGAVLRGESIRDAVSLAGHFISRSIRATESDDSRMGIDFEQFLGGLI